jgi:hypothetical protein
MLTPETLVLAALTGCLVLLWLLPFVARPVRMKFRSWQAADPVYSHDHEGWLPATARLAAIDLRELGFEDRGTWRHDGAARATGWVVLLEHPRTRDTAKVLVVAVGTRQSVALVFQTRFADDTEAVTTNSLVISGLPPPPGVTVAWLPEIRDPASLYHVHTHRAGRRRATRRLLDRLGIPLVR